LRVEDLHHKELLELHPEAMGILRRYLVANFGLTATRAVLTQSGFAHGWRRLKKYGRTGRSQ
jgi:hypothetical protein